VTRRATLTLALLVGSLVAALGFLWADGEAVAVEDEGVEPTSAADSLDLHTPALEARQFRNASPSEVAYDGLTLRVLDDEQKALENAEVLFVATGRIEEALLRETLLLSGWDRIPVMEQHGERFVTNARGEVRLPRFHDLASVAARHGELWSMLELHQGMEGPVALIVQASPALAIEVQDVEGKAAAGVPIVLRSRRGSSILDLWRGVSDSNGLLRIERVGAVAQQDRLGGVLEIAPGVPAPLSFARPVDLRALEHPLRVTAPPSGVLEVQVRVAGDGPLPRGTFVTLHGKNGAVGTFTLPVVDGLARTSHAALGAALDLEAHALERWQPESASSQGPADAVTPCLAEIRLHRRKPSVAARVANESGELLPLRSLRCHVLSRDGQHLRSLALRSDASAMVRLEWQSADPADALLRIFAQDHETGSQTASVDVLDPPERAPDVDLGLLMLRNLPPLVQGMVTDAEGHGLEGLVAAVEERRAGSVWRSATEVQCTTDRTGQFVIRGPRTEADLRVVVRHDRWRMAEPQAFRAGEQGLRLVLRKRAVLSGQVLTDASIDPRLLELNLESEHGGVSVATATPAADGRWTLQDVPRGTWRVSVSARGGHAEFVVVDGIHAHAETVEDARLACLDLRGRIRNVAVDVLDGQGAAISEAWVHVLGKRRGTWQQTTDGHLEVLLGNDPVDVFAEAEGFGRAAARAVAQNVTLKLGHGLAVRLDLLELPPPGTALHAWLVPADGRGFPARPVVGGLSAPAFSSDGVLEASVPSAGVWRLKLTLVRKGTEIAVGLPASAAEPISVSEGVQRQQFRVRVAAQALLEAERQLAQRP